MRLRNIPGAAEAVASSKLVVQQPSAARGRWKELFGKENPIYLEVGMGKGKFLTEQAMRNPDRSFVGIERYTSVLLRALQKREALETELENLLYLCIDARELPEVFAPGEAAGIYLNFSDPWPKDRHAKRRLPSREFLARYRQILAPGGCVEFKTDNEPLFDFALEECREAGWELVSCTRNLHREPEMMRDNIMTEYEEKFSALGNPIFKLIMRPRD